jgi:hypothetical protein
MVCLLYSNILLKTDYTSINKYLMVYQSFTTVYDRIIHEKVPCLFQRLKPRFLIHLNWRDDKLNCVLTPLHKL